MVAPPSQSRKTIAVHSEPVVGYITHTDADVRGLDGDDCSAPSAFVRSEGPVVAADPNAAQLREGVSHLTLIGMPLCYNAVGVIAEHRVHLGSPASASGGGRHPCERLNRTVKFGPTLTSGGTVEFVLVPALD